MNEGFFIFSLEIRIHIHFFLFVFYLFQMKRSTYLKTFKNNFLKFFFFFFFRPREQCPFGQTLSKSFFSICVCVCGSEVCKLVQGSDFCSEPDMLADSQPRTSIQPTNSLKNFIDYLSQNLNKLIFKLIIYVYINEFARYFDFTQILKKS